MARIEKNGKRISENHGERTRNRQRMINYKNVSYQQLIEKIKELKETNKQIIACLEELEAELERRKLLMECGLW